MFVGWLLVLLMFSCCLWIFVGMKTKPHIFQAQTRVFVSEKQPMARHWTQMTVGY